MNISLEDLQNPGDLRLELAQRSQDCKVFWKGQDISGEVRKVEVVAGVGEVTHVVLHMFVQRTKPIAVEFVGAHVKSVSQETQESQGLNAEWVQHSPVQVMR